MPEWALKAIMWLAQTALGIIGILFMINFLGSLILGMFTDGRKQG